MYDEIPGIRSVVSPGRQSEAAAPGERRYFFRYPYFDNDDVFTTRETGVFSGILAGEPTYPGRYYPGRVLSQPLRNLPGKVRNPDVRRTSETLRFQRSGPIWQRVWISAGGRGRSGDTGTDGRLALPGNRGLPAKKTESIVRRRAATTRNGRTYAAWRLLNAQRWNPTHRPQFASSSRTGTNGAGSELGQSDSEYTMPRKQKTLRIIDT